ncbi:MAG TPA: NAD(P)-dependent oxidoreductase, partial [Candidatus Nitrosopolaris sp.]|nr:NAD(P)-dependent oxidoreductase [Candidatus Nitrosopolaris sp.]
MQVSGKVLVCDEIDRSGLSALKNAGMTVDYDPDIDATELISRIKDYEVVIIRSRTKVSSEVIKAAISTKIIARVGVGLDNIDIEAANARGIRVINAAEAAMNAVAELAVGNMIALARSIPLADSQMKKGNWIKKDLIGTELAGKYLGLIGVGNIGRNMARIARGLRMNIIGYDIYPINPDFIKEVGLIKTDLGTLLESADFVSFHVPLTNATKHMLNASLLAKMKPTAYVINTSRGEVIDEDALYQALKSRRIAGAALDVFEIEPPTNRLLIELPNVICTPHIGSQTKESQALAS